MTGWVMAPGSGALATVPCAGRGELTRRSALVTMQREDG